MAKKTGFTLIELMIVLVIASSLIAIALGGLSYASAVSQDNALKQDAVSISQAMQEYYSANSYYPYAACPAAGGGPDQTGKLTSTLIPSATSGLLQEAYNDYTKAYNDIVIKGAVSSFGYCSYPSSNDTAMKKKNVILTITNPQ